MLHKQPRPFTIPALFASVMIAIIANKCSAQETSRTQTQNMPPAAASEEAASKAIHTLYGRVLDGDGKPLASARVEAVMLSVSSKPTAIERMRRQRGIAPFQMFARRTARYDGTFEITSLEEGLGLLVALKKGTVPVVHEVTVPTSAPVDLKFSSAKGATLRGKAINFLTKEPVKDVRIHVIANRILRHPSPDNLTDAPGELAQAEVASAQTGASGDFEIAHVPPGDLELVINASIPKLFLLPGNTAKQPFKAQEGETTTVGDLLLYPGYTVTGVITDAVTSGPVSGASVRVVNLPPENSVVPIGLTDKDGSFTLRRVDPPISGKPGSPAHQGTISISSQRMGYSKAAATLTVPMPVNAAVMHLKQDLQVTSETAKAP